MTVEQEDVLFLVERRDLVMFIESRREVLLVARQGSLLRSGLAGGVHGARRTVRARLSMTVISERVGWPAIC